MEAARRAAPDELPRLAQLADQARAELVLERGGVLLAGEGCRSEPGRDTGGLELWLDAPDRSLWAGTIDDVVVGVAAVHGGDHPGPGRFVLLYVEPEARGIGVGAALLGAGIDWLRARGYSGVDVPALPGIRATKQFLESEGLVARLIVMHRDID